MKSSPNHLCGQTEVVLCALQFHSLENLMFPPVMLGLALNPISLDHHFLWLQSVTSGWPSAPHMTSLTSAVAAQSCVCLLMRDCVEFKGVRVGDDVPIMNYDTGANWTNTTVVMQSKHSLWLVCISRLTSFSSPLLLFIFLSFSPGE